MRRLILPALFCLTACTTAPVGIQVRDVPVPTPTPCVKASDVPAEPAKIHDQLTGDAKHDLSIVAESALTLRKWGEELQALIVPACIAETP